MKKVKKSVESFSAFTMLVMFGWGGLRDKDIDDIVKQFGGEVIGSGCDGVIRDISYSFNDDEKQILKCKETLKETFKRKIDVEILRPILVNLKFEKGKYVLSNNYNRLLCNKIGDKEYSRITK